MLSGFGWILEGQGLHPWIAFPPAISIYFACWIWIIDQAATSECYIADYLEYLDDQHKHYQKMRESPDKFDINALKGGLIQLELSLTFWQRKINNEE
jgi:hypothetical protein